MWFNFPLPQSKEYGRSIHISSTPKNDFLHYEKSQEMDFDVRDVAFHIICKDAASKIENVFITNS